MKVFELTKIIESYANEYPNINYVEESGNIYNLNAHNNMRYTAFCALPTGVNLTENSDGDTVNEYNYNLFYVDRLENDEDNLLSIHSAGEEFFRYLAQKLYEDLGITYTNYNCSFFKERFNDLCAGVLLSVTLQALTDDNCYTTESEIIDVNKLIRQKIDQINGTNEGNTILAKLDVTDSFKTDLVQNLVYKGVDADESEGLNTLVPKIRDIISTNLTPTNAFAPYDCASYAQKYFDNDFPNVIVYRISPSNFEVVEFFIPYDCQKVVYNGVEYLNVASGTPVEIKQNGNIMFCFDNEHKEQKLKNMCDNDLYGNIGYLLEVYVRGVKITGWETLRGTSYISNNYILQRIVVDDTPEWEIDKTTAVGQANWPSLGSNTLTTVFGGLTRIRGTRNQYLQLNGRCVLSDLEELDLGNGYSIQLINSAWYVAPEFMSIYPKLKRSIGVPLKLSSYNPGSYGYKIKDYTLFSDVLEEVNWQQLLSSYINVTALTREVYDAISWFNINLPNSNKFTCTTYYNTNTAYTNMRSIKVGTVTTLSLDNSINRNFFVKNIEVGQDTDININLSGFNAGYAIRTDLIDDVKAECLGVLQNVRNGLLNKVKDHSADGETRTITLTNLIATMNDSGYQTVVDEMDSIIDDFELKGWTVI